MEPCEIYRKRAFSLMEAASLLCKAAEGAVKLGVEPKVAFASANAVLLDAIENYLEFLEFSWHKSRNKRGWDNEHSVLIVTIEQQFPVSTPLSVLESAGLSSKVRNKMSKKIILVAKSEYPLLYEDGLRITLTVLGEFGDSVEGVSAARSREMFEPELLAMVESLRGPVNFEFDVITNTWSDAACFGAAGAKVVLLVKPADLPKLTVHAQDMGWEVVEQPRPLSHALRLHSPFRLISPEDRLWIWCKAIFAQPIGWRSARRHQRGIWGQTYHTGIERTGSGVHMWREGMEKDHLNWDYNPNSAFDLYQIARRWWNPAGMIQKMGAFPGQSTLDAVFGGSEGA